MGWGGHGRDISVTESELKHNRRKWHGMHAAHARLSKYLYAAAEEEEEE